MTCKCNCHDKSYREANGMAEHATCMECAFAIAEEDARYAEIERILNQFLKQDFDTLPSRYARIVNERFWELT